jgi:hypothetical protein
LTNKKTKTKNELVRTHDGTFNETFSFVGSCWPKQGRAQHCFSSDFANNESTYDDTLSNRFLNPRMMGMALAPTG